MMKRLTKNKDEIKNWQYLTNGGKLVDEKLSKLEDIEELFVKMNRYGIYAYGEYISPYFKMTVLLDGNKFVVIFENMEDAFYLEDYGKTWALTREELEND